MADMNHIRLSTLPGGLSNLIHDSSAGITVPTRDNDRRTSAGEPEGDLTAQPTAPSSDDGDLPVERPGVQAANCSSHFVREKVQGICTTLFTALLTRYCGS